MTKSATQPGGARVAVTWNTKDEALGARAAAIAKRLHLPLIAAAQAYQGYDLLLTVRADRLEIRESSPRARGLYVDFVGGATGYRRKSGVSRREPIARAVGPRKSGALLIDATAGLARDTFTLARLGWRVMAIERSPVLAEVVTDGIKRALAARSTALRRIIERIELVVADAREALPRLKSVQSPDVVYLDPMYPPKKKAALPKKEMRLCRSLVGDDSDAAELLSIARQAALRRVVVKRHPHAPPLAPDSDLVFSGKSVRYDVYLSAR